jgi:hypothetical protein
MDMAKYAGTSFLSLDDVQDGPFRGVITAIEPGSYGKPVLTFDNGLRLSLNVTNVTTLIKAWGSESDDWIGERVEAYAGETKYQGETKRSVLVRALARKTGAEVPPPPQPAAARANANRGDMDDEIPF